MAYVALNAGNAVIVTPPSSVITTANWSLTKPVNSGGELFYNTYINPSSEVLNSVPPGDATRSLAAATASLTGFSAPYFYVSNTLGYNEVNFIAPVFGSTTTPNTLSNHVRCELRGTLTGTGATSNEWREANQGQLTGVARVIQRPAATGDVDFIQIHGGGSNGSLVFLIAVLRSTGTLQMTNRNFDQTSRATTDLATGIVNGDVLSYQMTYGPTDNVVISLSVNGTPASGSPFTISTDSTWSTKDVHFAAGSYSNTDVLLSNDYATAHAAGDLLRFDQVTDRGWIAYRSLSQILLAP